MKRKIVASLFFGALVAATSVTFYSCKDTDEDLYAKFEEENATLEDKMNKDLAALQGKLDALQEAHDKLKEQADKCFETCQTAWTIAINGLKTEIEGKYVSNDALNTRLEDYLTVTRFNEFYQEYTVLAGTVGNLEKAIDEINYVLRGATNDKYATVGERFTAIETAVATAQSAVDKVEADLAKVDARVTGLSNDITTINSTLATIVESINNVQGNVNDMQGNINDMQGNINDMQGNINDMQGNINDMQGNINDMQGNINDMQGNINDIQSNLDDAVAGINGDLAEIIKSIAESNTKIADLQGGMSVLEGKVGIMNDKITSINDEISTIKSDISTIKADVTNAQNDATDALTLANANKVRLDAMDEVIAEIKAKDIEQDGRLKALEDGLNEETNNIAELRADLDQAISDCENNLAEAKSELQNAINEVAGDVTDVKNDVSDLKGDVDDLTGEVNGVKLNVAALQTSMSEVQDAIGDLNNSLSDLEERVKANEDAIEEINDQLAELIGLPDRVKALEDRVSSIVIQQVMTPMLGNITMPFDVQSMILFAYHGETDNYVKFPDFDPRAGHNFGSTYYFDDTSFFKGEYFELAAGEGFINDYDGNMGKVYFTVNPANIDMTGKEFYLVNSKGQNSKVLLKNVKPSSKLISFGYSRAATSSNGFYEADATLPVNDIHAVSINVEPGLKSAVKDAVKDRTVSSVGNLVRMLYREMSGFLPALGIKASWDENGKNQSVYSQYSIAATSIKPLSYKLLDGTTLGDRLPSLPDIDNLADKFDFTINAPKFKFTMEDIQISSPVIDFSLDINTEFTIDIEDIDATVTVHVTVPEQEVDVLDEFGNKVGTAVIPEDTYTGTGTGTVNGTAINDQLNAQLKDKFERLFGDLSDQMKTNVQDAVDQVINTVNQEVNDKIREMLDTVAEDINTQMGDVINDIQNQIRDKVEAITNRIERFYDKFERAYNKIGKLIDNPNHYLQAMMLYKSGDKIGRLSNSKAAPSVWTGTGTAATLVATTYNAEVITPAFKKYVAITNVYDANGNDCSNNAVCKQLRDKANAGQYMNEVVPGARQTVAFDFSAGRAAAGEYTYEIFYQALDYHGYTSTQKYYVKIK